MSWGSVTDYFEGIMNGEGYSLHKEAFSYENIANTRIEKAYHIELGTITGDGQNQRVIETTMPLTLRFFKKGYRDPHEARNEALAKAQTIVQKAVKSASRVSNANFKNVSFDSLASEPLALSNDHLILMTMEFSILVLLEDLD